MSWGDLSRELAWDDPTSYVLEDDDDDLDVGRLTIQEQRELAKGKRGWEAESVQLHREVTFLKAGIPRTPLGVMFHRAYDGPVDVASVAAAWAELQPAPVVEDD